MTAATSAGIQYTPGDYHAILRYGVGKIGAINNLFGQAEYKDIKGIGKPW